MSLKGLRKYLNREDAPYESQARAVQRWAQRLYDELAEWERMEGFIALGDVAIAIRDNLGVEVRQ